jgi:hypothetical protein
MNTIEIAVIAAATLLGPIFAVQAQKFIERATERGKTRRAIFHALMSNRATRLHDDFVKALNLIDLEFREPKDKPVIDAWRALFGEYREGPAEGASEDVYRAWNQRIDDRLVALLLAMSKALGYEFSEEELRRGIYYPKGRVDLEQSQMIVLHGLRLALEGKLSIPMKVTDAPSSPELVAAQTALAERGAKAYDEDGFVRVRIVDDRAGAQSRTRRSDKKSFDQI